MKGKAKIGVTVSPITERQLDSLVESHRLFSSRSDAVEKSIAMMYFAVNHDMLGMVTDGVGVIAPV